MKAQPRNQRALSAGSATVYPSHERDGEPVRRPRRPALPDHRLYRYVPVPPVYRDEDGYPIEDGMSQNVNHQVQTAHWRTALQPHCPRASGFGPVDALQARRHHRVLVPDLLVALCAERRPDRRSYRLWENPLPDLVMEMLSESTSETDVGSKRDTYEHLGIREYWLFDPEGFELSTPLVGYRLRGGRYRRIDADAAGRLRSEVWASTCTSTTANCASAIQRPART